MVSKRWPWRRSTFREANRVSLDALSQQLPLRLIEAVMPHFRSRQLNSWLAYWLPRSLWKIGPAFLSGLRRNQAISSASMTRLLCISDCIDQPTTRRLNRSITTARQPALVGWDVGDVAGPRPVRRGHRKVAIQQVGCDRQAVSAVGCGNTAASLAAGAGAGVAGGAVR